MTNILLQDYNQPVLATIIAPSPDGTTAMLQYIKLSEYDIKRIAEAVVHELARRGGPSNG